MQYFGGKHRLASDIVKVMPMAEAYVEPFVGGASVLCAAKYSTRMASDANRALISMWTALQAGWEPPSNVSEDDYAAAKYFSDDDPRKAYIGFGLSFSGKWFGGYARNSRGDDYAANARNSLLRKAKKIIGVTFRACDYRSVEYPKDAIIYCDPPYKGTTQYGAVPPFEWPLFWKFYEGLARSGRAVFVSEYAAPEGWESVFEKITKTEIRTKANGRELRIEKLFSYKQSGWDKMWSKPFVQTELL